jgi:hypothetical protein
MLRQGKLGEYDVVILDGHLPQIDTPGPEGAGPIKVAGLPPGRFLVFGGVPAGPSGLIDKGKGPGASIVDWSRDHPVLRTLTLDNLIIGETRLVETVKGGPATTIATADNGAAVIEIASSETRALVVPFDVAQSNWPFDVSFVVFMGSAINFLGDDAAGTVGRLVQPGSVLSDRLPAGAEDVELKGPDGKTNTLSPAVDGRIVFGPLSTSGVYEVTWKGPRGQSDVELTGGRVLRMYASNLLDPEESNAAALEQISLATDVLVARAEAAKADKKLWPWLLLAALLIVMLEWFVYNRKVQI